MEESVGPVPGPQGNPCYVLLVGGGGAGAVGGNAPASRLVLWVGRKWFSKSNT